jgi:hypothetical protein
MSNVQRWSLLVLAVVVLVVGYIVLRPKDDKSDSASDQTITVKDGKPVGGIKELDFDKGGTIHFTVTASAPGGEVHFHGYDIAKEIPESGGSVTYDVSATIQGIFEVEMEATGVQIAKVVVQ